MPFGGRRFTSEREVANPMLLEEEGKVIIAMKGLPYTGKSEVAMHIGQWARCPVVSIDDFLDAVCMEKGYTAESFPCKEEGERFRVLATYALYKMAHRHLDSHTCVVIKSRLSSSFELTLLKWLVEEISDCSNLVIIECRMRNEFRFRARMDDIVNKEFHCKANSNDSSIMKDLEKHKLSHIVKPHGHLEWYKARSWKDVQNAKEDCLDDEAWNDHLIPLINNKTASSYPLFVSRLVVDSFDDLNLHFRNRRSMLPPDFLHIINHLLNRWFKDKENRFLVTEFNALRRRLVEDELSLSVYCQRSQSLCIRDGDSCVFRYCDQDQEPAYDCWVCQQPLDSAYYTCHFCILTLHESCAKVVDFNFLQYAHDLPDGLFFFNYSDELSKLKNSHPCKPCEEEGNPFSRDCASCLFETHLNRGLLPTIINHDSHEHFLSIQFKPDTLCGPEYICHICKFHMYMDAFLLPRELKHEHGGYEHVMKLVFVHDAMEPEDDYWCNVCYGDMDPQAWFYSCQECPYYITHLYCAGKGKEKSIHRAIGCRKVAFEGYESRSGFRQDMMKPADDDQLMYNADYV